MLTNAELRRLSDAAAGGPWRHYGMAGVASEEYDIVSEIRVSCEGCGDSVALTGCLSSDEAAFIAAAVNHVRSVLAEGEGQDWPPCYTA